MSTALRSAGAAPDGEAGQTLQAQREAWEARPLVRTLYHDWYRRIAAQLASVSGPTIELGCGIGSFKEFMPGVVATDVIASPWSDEVVDARELPYADGSVANLVMIDVIHHLAQPFRSLEEAQRVLVPGGRVIALEPFCSPLSRPLYRRFHQERLDESVDPLSDRSHTGRDPWDANIALPTLLFWRDASRLQQRLPELGLVTRERLAWLAYPLSGGFFARPLVPRGLSGLLRRVEAALPFERVAAFRCLVTLEKRAA